MRTEDREVLKWRLLAARVNSAKATTERDILAKPMSPLTMPKLSLMKCNSPVMCSNLLHRAKTHLEGKWEVQAKPHVGLCHSSCLILTSNPHLLVLNILAFLSQVHPIKARSMYHLATKINCPIFLPKVVCLPAFSISTNVCTAMLRQVLKN